MRAVLKRVAYAYAVISPNPLCCRDAIPASTTGTMLVNIGPCSSSHFAVPGYIARTGRAGNSAERNHSLQGPLSVGKSIIVRTRPTTCCLRSSCPPTWW